ncbi:MAG: amidohydrolase, partial [Chitinophagaceae bacterium]|nr:amidohydrolase [Chitinophagaceae bacterium]
MKKNLLVCMMVIFPTMLWAQKKQDSLWKESLKKSALEHVQLKAKNIQEMVDMVFSFGELGFQE